MPTKSEISVRTAFVMAAAVLLPSLSGPTPAQAQTWPGYAPRQIPTIQVTANDSHVIEIPGGAAKVFVANPGIADVEALDNQRLIVFGRSRGSSTIVGVTRYGTELKYNIVVTRPLDQLRASLASQFPTSALDVFDAPTGLTVSGTMSNSGEAEKARKVISQFLEPSETLNFNVRITTGSQVNLHVRVIEVARDVSKSLGFNLSGLITGGSTQIGVLTGRAPFVAGSAGLTGDEIFSRSQSSLQSIGLKYASGNDTLGGIIDALAAQNQLKVLAEPNLTSASGETANFLAGGQIPVPVAQGAGNNAQATVEWKDFGIGLKFTPTIIDSGNISIKVNSEVSELSDIGSARLGNYVIPSISTRRVETTVNLAAGQSFAIAGLFNERSSRSLQQFPGLGSIPIIGELFRSRAFRSSKTELIVIVTPFLTAPANSISEIALPADAPDAQSPLLQTNSRPEEQASEPGQEDSLPKNAQTRGELEPVGRTAANDSGARNGLQLEPAQ